MLIVGAGLSGLTAAAYLVRAGHEVRVLEKAARAGGLVGSFAKDGIVFDTGPRALGNAGILLPMLDDLQVRLPMVKGTVSTGIRDEIVHFDGEEAVGAYTESLARLFPGSRGDIGRIGARIRHYCALSRVLNRMPNPFFKDPLGDPRYLVRDFLPWLPSFFRAVAATSLWRRSVENELDSLTADASLKDMVCQHFFKGTPASFALGYIESFFDYRYPLGGTGQLPRALEEKITAGGGAVLAGREVVRVLPGERKVVDQHGEEHSYDRLLWASDLRSLYRRLEGSSLAPRIRRGVEEESRKYLDARSGESAFTVFLGVKESPEYFGSISRGHFIYTPRIEGLGELHRSGVEELKRSFPGVSRPALFQWVADFCARSSFEISIPALKDRSLAPPGTTGLVVSLLVDGALFKKVDEAGLLDEVRQKVRDHVLDALGSSVYPGLGRKVLFAETATPLTLARRFNTSDGAITGWSLEEKAPVPDSLAGIMAVARTAIPSVYKAGQWSYSPSGVPIAILTGRIAAAAMQK